MISTLHKPELEIRASSSSLNRPNLSSPLRHPLDSEKSITDSSLNTQKSSKLNSSPRKTKQEFTYFSSCSSSSLINNANTSYQDILFSTLMDGPYKLTLGSRKSLYTNSFEKLQPRFERKHIQTKHNLKKYALEKYARQIQEQIKQQKENQRKMSRKQNNTLPNTSNNSFYTRSEPNLKNNHIGADNDSNDRSIDPNNLQDFFTFLSTEMQNDTNESNTPNTARSNKFPPEPKTRNHHLDAENALKVRLNRINTIKNYQKKYALSTIKEGFVKVRNSSKVYYMLKVVRKKAFKESESIVAIDEKNAYVVSSINVSILQHTSVNNLDVYEIGKEIFEDVESKHPIIKLKIPALSTNKTYKFYIDGTRFDVHKDVANFKIFDKLVNDQSDFIKVYGNDTQSVNSKRTIRSFFSVLRKKKDPKSCNKIEKDFELLAENWTKLTQDYYKTNK